MPEKVVSLFAYGLSFNPCFRGTCSWCSKRFWHLGARFGFNPCFRGTCSWCFGGLPLHADELVFQSLFSWNLLLMCVAHRLRPLDSSSFNPCFRGTCSWCTAPSRSSTRICTVSILVFVELALDVYIYSKLTNFSIVSILVFVELALDGQKILITTFWNSSFNPCFRGTCSWWAEWYYDGPGLICFNPCFRGTCSWCPQTFRTECGGARVSILVFVELALDVWLHHPSTCLAWGFNPCFRGTCSWW